MPDFLKKLLTSSFVRWVLNTSLARAFMTSEIRHLATLASGFALAWLVSHGVLQGDASHIAEGIASIVLGLGGYGLSKLNASNNKAVVQAAAETGLVLPPAQAKAVIASEARTAADTKTDQSNERTVTDVKEKAAALPGADDPVVPAALADELRNIQ